MSPSHFHNATLTINLDALASNWRRLDSLTGSAETAAVIKANAYGLGAAQVSRALAAAGCRTFFVANAIEGEAVLAARDDADIRLYVLNGVDPTGLPDLLQTGMRPVLSTIDAIRAWASVAARLGRQLHCGIQIDTGMTRLGLLGREVEQLKSQPELLEGLKVDFWMTHLSCGDEPQHPMNKEQLSLFHDRVCGLPEAPLSIANSAGIFLGNEWHLDLCRPGIALYGSNPMTDMSDPMDEVVHVSARILQVHDLERSRMVGYGASHASGPGTRIATCGIGYADGYLRSLSGQGYGMIAGHRVPLVGRVSMDLITFDVTDVPISILERHNEISIIGGGVDIDELAALGGTIAYELLTGLGNRFARRYLSERRT